MWKLAIVTTAELPPEACGKGKVSYPAVFAPTKEAVLMSGSLVQLGDDTVQLALDDVAELDQVDTCVCRLNLYRDEVEIPWDKILEAPLRALIQAVPAFTLCRDQACKGDCARFHPSLEEAVDQVILEVWARKYLKQDGSRSKPDDSELFQAYIRVPESAVEHIFNRYVQGVYLEPRAHDTAGPHAAWTVVWLPGSNLQAACHALKTTEKALALARQGRKYGLRTKEVDEQTVFTLHRPHHDFLKLKICAKYRLHPLPHGTQRHSITALLKKWGWAARPLQPEKGDASGATWLVGVESDPPAPAMPLADGFVAPMPKPVASIVCGSTRTLKHLQQGEAATEVDPWWGGKILGLLPEVHETRLSSHLSLRV